MCRGGRVESSSFLCLMSRIIAHEKKTKRRKTRDKVMYWLLIYARTVIQYFWMYILLSLRDKENFQTHLNLHFKYRIFVLNVHFHECEFTCYIF